MSQPLIHVNRATFSASRVLSAVGDELGLIRQQDGMTWADIGRVLGKSDDQAAKYALGTAEMGIVAYAAAKREWNGRFTGALDRLCRDSRPVATDDHTKQTQVLEAALTIARALQDRGRISPDDVRSNRAVMEAARDALTEVLDTLTPREVRA